MISHNTIDVQLQDTCQVLLTSTTPIFEDLIKCKTKVSLNELIDLFQSLKLVDIGDQFLPLIPKCPDCEEIFSINSELIMHFQTSHGKDNFEVEKEDNPTPPKNEGEIISEEGNWLSESINDLDSEMSSFTALKEVIEIECKSVSEEKEKNHIKDNISIQQQNGSNIERESKSESGAKEELERRKIHICHECGKKYTEPRYLRKHIEIEHKGIRYTCEHCKGKFTEHKYLQKHIAKFHLGQTFDCDKCDYKAFCKALLNNHIRSKHQGILYFCDQCELKTPHKPYLTVHKKAKHGDARLQCHQCDYKTSYSTQLYYHLDTKHNNKKFLCDQCDFVTNVKAKLKYHVKTKHAIIFK